MKKNIMLVVLLGSSFAISANIRKPVVIKSMPLPALPEFVLSTQGLEADAYKAQLQKKMNESKKLNRQIAQTDTIDEKGFLSESYIQIRNQFFAIKNAEQLDAMITQLSQDDYFNKLDRDGQFLALQFTGLKTYKSFFYRARTYVGRHSAIRSAFVTSLRLAAVAQQRFSPTAEQKALFDYFTTPINGMGSDIVSDADVENFLASEIMPATNVTYKRLTLLIKKDDKPIHWDNKVYASFANFADSADRYAQIGLPEQFLLLAGFEQTIAGQLVSSAYSLTGYSEMINALTTQFGVDSLNLLTKVDGISAKKRFEILKRYPQLFSLKAGGAGYTQAAFGFLKASLQNSKTAWAYLQMNQPANTQIAFVINPQNLMPFSRQINSGFTNLDSLFSGTELSSAVINGEKISINFEKLFTNPPQSMAQFYPTQFNTEKAVLTKMVNGKATDYRNYLTDSASGWDYSAFKTYLPTVKAVNSKTADVSKELRVISQIWGANVLGVSLSALVF